MPRIESIVIHQGPQGAKGDPSLTVGPNTLALGSGQYPKGNGTNVVAGDFAADVANTAAVKRVDPGDSPADSIIVRSAAGTPVSILTPHVYAVARGFVPASNAAGVAAANATVLQQIWDEGKVAILPRGTHYYGTTLKPRSNCGLLSAGAFYTKLVYTGTGNGMSGLRDTDLLSGQTGIYNAYFVGVELSSSGAATGHGFTTDCYRQSYMESFNILLFAGSGFRAYGQLSTFLGTWSNRFINCSFSQNGRHGVEALGDQHNINAFFGCTANSNGLNGVYAEQPQKWVWGFQTETNARHGVEILGGRAEDLSSLYMEHYDPGDQAANLQPPGYVKQSPRYMIKLGKSPAPYNTNCRSITIGAAYLEGGHGNGTTVTDAAIYAEYVDNLTIDQPQTLSVKSNLAYQIQPTCGSVRISPANYNRQTIVTPTDRYGNLLARLGAGPRTTDTYGPVSRAEGYANLLTNGGFDTYTTTPGLPDGWALNGTGTFEREAGTDGGYRLKITNIGVNFSGVKQVLTGPAVGFMAGRTNRGIVVFDAIVPTANTYNTGMCRVYCKDSGGATLTPGGYTFGGYLPPNDTEQTYTLPFYVPPGTVTIEVWFVASTNSTTNTDVLKVDRAAVYPGEVAKAYMPKPLPAPVAPLAYTTSNVTTTRTLNASTATTADVANALGTLLADLKAAGIVG